MSEGRLFYNEQLVAYGKVDIENFIKACNYLLAKGIEEEVFDANNSY